MSQSTPLAAPAKQLQAIRQRVNANAPLESLIQELARQLALIEELSLQVRVLRAQQGLAEVLLPRADVGYAGLDHAQLDAGMPLDPAKGFYGLEYDGNGHAFRWTGPSPVFWFDLHLDRSAPLRATLRIASGYGEASDQLRAFADGIELPLQRQAVAGGITYTLLLLPRAANGISRLSFLVKQMLGPSPARTDTRTLGVAFCELSVTPADEAEARRYLDATDDLVRVRLALSVAEPAGIVAPETEPTPEAPADQG